MNQVKTIFIVLIMIAFIGSGATWIIQQTNLSYDLPVIKPVPSFSYKTQDGTVFTEKALQDKVSVLDFMFTSCTGPCPTMTNNMKHLYDYYEEVPDVQFVSVTVDPETDTEEILKLYADANGVKDNRWQFLTSDIGSIKDLSRNGFMLYAGELPRGHAIKFILIDHLGQIRKYYDGTDKASIRELRTDLNYLLKETKL